MRRIIARSLVVLGFVVTESAGPAAVVPAAAESTLEVQIDADKNVYVLREPIRLSVSIANASDRTVRVPLIEDFSGLLMWFTFFEVTNPDGSVELLRNVRVLQNRIWNFETQGAPLRPGNAITCFYYPNLANRHVDPSGKNVQAIPLKSIFDCPGTYRLRVVYSMGPEFTNLEQGTWPSNQSTLRIVEADRQQAEILDAMWHSMPEGESGVDHTRIDLDQLARVVNEYPDNSLTNHARFALARAYYAESFRNPAMAKAAIELLNELISHAPDFRYEEVRLFLSRSLIANGELDRAQDVLLCMMSSRSALWSNYRFVEQATIPGITRNGFRAEWQNRERSIGAVPMTKKEVISAASE